MSDTPRTDELIEAWGFRWESVTHVQDLSKQLERELNSAKADLAEAKARIKHLENQTTSTGMNL